MAGIFRKHIRQPYFGFSEVRRALLGTVSPFSL